MMSTSSPGPRVRAGRWTAGVLILAGAVLVPGIAAAQETAVKIAVVDLDLIVANSAAGKRLQGQLEQFQANIRAEAETMTSAARDIRQRMSEGVNSLSEDKLAELQKQYEDKTIEIRRYQDDKQREGQKIQQEGLREIEKQLEPVFKKIQDEGGYDIILNNVPGVVVMSSPKVDITQLVVDTLNSMASGS